MAQPTTETGHAHPYTLPPPVQLAAHTDPEQTHITPHTSPPNPKPRGPNSRFDICGLAESYTPAKADPWVQRKVGVGFLLAIAGYTSYVLIGRACVPAIRQSGSAAGWSFGTGVGVLVGYITVFLIMAWTYLRMITASPGYAKEVIPRAPPPTITDQTFPLQQQSQPHPSPIPTQTSPSTQYPDRIVAEEAPDPSELAPAVQALSHALHPATTNDRASSATLASQTPPTASKGKQKAKWQDVQRPVPQVTYGQRWCRFCEINKPDRTHHCRHCGTCVMQFDHHCIWIGQCVGWANHKFFITFNLWGTLYWYYTLITLIIYLARSSEVDGQVIAIIAVSAIFGLFTSAMLGQHVYLIITGKSTVESFAGQDQHNHEGRVLGQQLGHWSGATDARRARKRWEVEWGGSAVDERWRAGGAWELWKREMGERWYMWIFPLGRPLGDGIHFPSNPRFGPNGEWLRKVDWPEGVQ